MQHGTILLGALAAALALCAWPLRGQALLDQDRMEVRDHAIEQAGFVHIETDAELQAYAAEAPRNAVILYYWMHGEDYRQHDQAFKSAAIKAAASGRGCSSASTSTASDCRDRCGSCKRITDSSPKRRRSCGLEQGRTARRSTAARSRQAAWMCRDSVIRD